MKSKVQILSEGIEGISSVLGEEDFSYLDIPRKTFIKAIYPTVVTEAFCSDCIICETMCPVLKFDHTKRIMTLNETACKGCGNCIPACPTSALQQRNATHGDIEYNIKKILTVLNEKTPISCNYCPIRNGDLDDDKKIENGGLRLICSGRIEPAPIIDAVHQGVGGVVIFGCRFPDYKFENNLPIAEKRIKMTMELMDVLGWNKERLKVEWVTLQDEGFKNMLKKYSTDLRGESI